MNVVIGLAIGVAPLLIYRGYRGRLSIWTAVLNLLEGGLVFGMLMGGLLFAQGRSARVAALRGAVVGGFFALSMGVFFAVLVGYVSIFRRTSWTFHKAWAEAGLPVQPDGGGRFAFARALRPSRIAAVRRLREVQACFRRQWETNDRGQSAADFIRAHMFEIEADLRIDAS